MFKNKNNDYLEDMFDQITKYEKCLKNFDKWFKDVSYDKVKDMWWYKEIENDVIKHLNNEFATREYDKFQENKSNDSCFFSTYDELQGLCIHKISQQNDIFFNYHVSEDSFKQFKKKYVENISCIKKDLFSNIDFTKQDWSKSENFQKNAFDVIKQFEKFKSNTENDFFRKNGLLTRFSPTVKLKDLITSPNFITELKEYFSLDNEKRKTHKLKKIFSYRDKLIIIYHRYGNCSFEYGLIQDQQTISNDDRLLIFCSLVEFYGKDFFDGLPENEKRFIRDFYKNHPEFKLSDPSIIGNFGDKNKPDENKDSDLDLRIEVIEENSVKQNLSINEGKILITDNNATYNQISNSNAKFIEENSGKENLPTDKNKIKNQSNNFVTNNNTKTDTIKQNKILDLNTKVIEKNLGNQNLLTDNNEISMTDNNIKLKSKSSDTNTLNNIGNSKNKQNEISAPNTTVIKEKSGEENLFADNNKISMTNHNTQPKSKKTKKSYTKARVGVVVLGISFVVSLILAWQVSVYILIASAILLAIFIICLITLKKSGFECTKIFCFCMDVEDEPQKEISRDNNLSNPELNGTEIHIK